MNENMEIDPPPVLEERVLVLQLNLWNAARLKKIEERRAELPFRLKAFYDCWLLPEQQQIFDYGVLYVGEVETMAEEMDLSRAKVTYQLKEMERTWREFRRTRGTDPQQQYSTLQAAFVAVHQSIFPPLN